MPKFEKSKAKGKKYSVITPSGRRINFGDATMEHYKDRTGLGVWSHKNHLDRERRKRYLARAKGIRDKNGNLTYLDKESPNYYSVKYLW